MSPPIMPQNGTELSELQLGRFREVFEIFDADKSGAICIKELGVVMRALGQEADDEELEDIMKEFDENNDGVISFNEFVEIMKERIKTHEVSYVSIYGLSAGGTYSYAPIQQTAI